MSKYGNTDPGFVADVLAQGGKAADLLRSLGFREPRRGDPCPHEWHRGSIVNGVVIEDCQLCGASRPA